MVGKCKNGNLMAFAFVKGFGACSGILMPYNHFPIQI